MATVSNSNRAAPRRRRRGCSRRCWRPPRPRSRRARFYVREETSRAEREHPPTGRFITVDGVRLHYLDTGGRGPALVLLHGNGAMIADMRISGLVSEASRRYRVIAFDRPGYGYKRSSPRQSLGTAGAGRSLQQRVRAARSRPPLVFGHSWGTQVALSLALDHPDSVGSSDETTLMIPAAAELAPRYPSLRLPVCILAGADDKIVDTAAQVGAPPRNDPGSELRVLSGLGHMMHYFATDQVVRAIDGVAARLNADVDRTGR